MRVRPLNRVSGFGHPAFFFGSAFHPRTQDFKLTVPQISRFQLLQLGPMEGIEPPAPGVSIRCSNGELQSALFFLNEVSESVTSVARLSPGTFSAPPAVE